MHAREGKTTSTLVRLVDDSAINCLFETAICELLASVSTYEEPSPEHKFERERAVRKQTGPIASPNRLRTRPKIQ
jgi:hypothetical protein